MEILSAILILIVFGSILFLAIVTTRLIGGRMQNNMRGKHMSVVETINIGVDKKILLLKVSEQFILISSSGKNVEFLSKIQINDIENIETEQNSNHDFKDLFDKYLQIFKNNKGLKKNKDEKISMFEETSNSTGDDTFKANLSKLRNITSKSQKSDNVDGVEFTDEK